MRNLGLAAFLFIGCAAHTKASSSPPASESARDADENKGSPDKASIRASIRPHLDEVRTCYEQGLVAKPTLAGRVVVQFSVIATGQAVSSVVASSTLGDAVTERCIADAVKRWTFEPRPGRAVLVVAYPFVLKAEDPK